MTAFALPTLAAAARTALRTYAKEDTVPAVVFGEVVVEANRLSLNEILRISIEAEKKKYEDIDDMAFTTTVKAVVHYGNVKDANHKREVYEEVSRIYRKRPDLEKEISLASRQETIEPGKEPKASENEEQKKEKKEHDAHEKDGEIHVNDPPEADDDEGVAVSIGSSRDKFTDLPFFFEDLDHYTFSIEERKDLEARVLYRIAFVPRSDFLSLPSGEFWVDTTDFQIFHANLEWTGNVPVPIVLEGLDYVAIDKKRVDGHWVYDRLSGRIKLKKIPFVKIPREVEFVVAFSDYAINQDLSPEVFGASPDAPEGDAR